jgi:hypothetical protein
MHPSFRFLLASAAVMAAFQTAAAQTTVLRNDDLSSGSNWLKYSGSGVTLANNALSVTAGSHAITYFTDAGSFQSLAENRTLEVTLTLKFTNVGSGGGTFRVGLFDSNTSSRPTGTTTIPDPVVGYGPSSSAAFVGYDGYAFTWNPKPGTSTNNLRLYERTPLEPTTTDGKTVSTQLLNTTAVPTFSVAGQSGGPTKQNFTTTDTYTLTYSVSRGTDTTLTFGFNVSGGSLVGFYNSFTVSDPKTSQFDTFALYAVTDSASNVILDDFRVKFLVDSVGQAAVPEPSTYAACAGAAVLGLAFWRRRRAAAKAAVA